MSDSVLFERVAVPGGQVLGLATLNRPQALNGLDLEMCRLLLTQLQTWAQDESVALVILRGAGDKAFCAGGDLHALYAGMQANQGGQPWDNQYAREFFDIEYRLDYLIHTYPKPVLCWGDGIVMGGGVGLFNGASHRVVTDSTRFAMPEIAIGLFPDVGGTWMLARLPAGVGHFLALSGAQINAGDCLFLGLADAFLPYRAFPALLDALTQQDWQGKREQLDRRLYAVIDQVRGSAQAALGPLERHYAQLRALCAGRDFERITQGLLAWHDSSDPWLARASQTFAKGSPGSARLSHALLERVRHLSLADVFRLEYIVSLQCGVQGDFQEGIRALLIDKDKQPRWNPDSLEKADAQWVTRFFQPSWPAGMDHPLADLGRNMGEAAV
ncbi:MAG TPA: enoyl-CoA hydratase/isomerase family protein [Alcaligenes sp.]|nr:enoyl-CoA hydratase/isomerase family protein [Alcaligenes sp.]HRL26811.1 enoyl-CoA hydratase/isomerase family protein [Alcaligenes sp.]